jgi:hypothetical protein
MDNIRLNGKAAVRIAARYIRSFRRKGKVSKLFDCEGDEVWFPSEYIKDEGEGIILIEKWLYDAKVNNGEL